MIDYRSRLNKILEIYRHKLKLKSNGFNDIHLQYQLTSACDELKLLWFNEHSVKTSAKLEIIYYDSFGYRMVIPYTDGASINPFEVAPPSDGFVLIAHTDSGVEHCNIIQASDDTSYAKGLEEIRIMNMRKEWILNCIRDNLTKSELKSLQQQLCDIIDKRVKTVVHKQIKEYARMTGLRDSWSIYKVSISYIKDGNITDIYGRRPKGRKTPMYDDAFTVEIAIVVEDDEQLNYIRESVGRVV